MSGDLEAAVAGALERADLARASQLAGLLVAQSPTDLGALVLAGRALLEADKPGEAFHAFTLALSIDPTSQDALCGRAAAAFARGDMTTALADAKRAHELRPAEFVPVMALGAPAICVQDLEATRSCFAFIERIDPEKAEQILEFWSDRLADLELYEQAAVVLRSAIDSGDPPYERLIKYAARLLGAFKPEAAIAAIDRAAAMRPQRAEAYSLRAQWALQQGDIEAAAIAAREAVTRDGRNEIAYLALAEAAPERIDEADQARLREVLGDSGLHARKRTTAGFALGIAREAHKDYDGAFAAFADANKIERDFAREKGFAYDPVAAEAKVSEIKQTFPCEVLRRASPDPMRGRGRIFVIGMPRSGTTLVDQILASHSRVRSAGESRAMSAVQRAFDLERAAGGDIADLIERQAAAWESAYIQGLDSAAKSDFSIDKNVMNIWSVGLILRLFPAARIIFVQRDPMDVCLSIFRLNFRQAFAFSSDLLDIAHYHRCYRALAEHWTSALPDRILTVRYEDLIESLEATVRGMLDFCGLPMEEACLRFHDNRRPVFTLSAAQVRKPIYSGARERWRKYEKHLAPLKTALGIEP